MDPLSRLTRWIMLVFVLFAATVMLPDRLFTAIFWGVQIVLTMDDYFNGDDDERKRRWQTIKNKVKWAVYRPALKPVRVTVPR